MANLPADGVVVLTGGNEGIGHHLARTLLGDGYRVAVLDVEVTSLAALREAHPDRLRVFEADVTDDGDVQDAVGAVVEEWGRIDALVNNAAVFEFGLFADRDPAATRRVMEVNYVGYERTIRAVLPHMLARDAGVIHNVSSAVGLVGHPGLSGYAASKGAVEALTRSLRLELQHDDVAVTVMYPPATETRSAARLGYPDVATEDPEYVGRRLARKVGATRRAVYADWKTRLGITVARLVPSLVRRGTERFLDEGAVDADPARDGRPEEPLADE